MDPLWSHPGLYCLGCAQFGRCRESCAPVKAADARWHREHPGYAITQPAPRPPGKVLAFRPRPA